MHDTLMAHLSLFGVIKFKSVNIKSIQALMISCSLIPELMGMITWVMTAYEVGKSNSCNCSSGLSS
jgi:hypothetical protein